MRCSAFAAVLSVAAALSWYAQHRARAFVEARLLPAACAALGDYLQREVRVGGARSVSPCSIMLRPEMCCGMYSRRASRPATVGLPYSLIFSTSVWMDIPFFPS